VTANGVKRVVDVRLRNSIGCVSHALLPDLPLHGIDYDEEPQLAPTDELLRGAQSGATTRPQYAKGYPGLLAKRELERTLDPAVFDGGFLLCSEDSSRECHCNRAHR
jgi:hypothetical protein